MFTETHFASSSTKTRDVFYVDKPSSSKKGSRFSRNVPRRGISFSSPTVNNRNRSSGEVDPDTVNTKTIKSVDEQTDVGTNTINMLQSILVAEAGVTGEEAQNLAQIIVRKSLRPEDDEDIMSLKNVDEILEDLIKETLNKGPVIDNRKDLERDLTELLTDAVKRGAVNADTKDTISVILEKGHFPHKQIDETKQTLYDIARKMSERVKELKTKRRESHKVTAPEEDDYTSMCFKKIVSFLAPITADMNNEDKQKLKSHVKDTVAALNKISMNTSPRDDQISQMLPVLLKLIQNVPRTIDTPEEELAKDLLQNLAGIVSTSSSSPLNSSTQSQRMEEIRLAEAEYIAKLEDEIEKWLSSLPIDQQVLTDSNFKNTIIIDLAGDIVDRQNYHQLHPASKPSAKEELEELKYEIFRWLNKFLQSTDLEVALSAADELMNAIRCLHVPSLNVGTSPTYTDALANEIAAYVDKTPPGYLGVDKSEVPNAINDLVGIIDKVKDKPDVDSKIDEAISGWVPKIFNKVSKTELNKMEKDLTQILKEKGFTDDTWILGLSLDPSKFLEENLNSALMDWLKSTPLYLSKSQQEKREMESAVNGLGNGLKQAFKRVISSSALGDIDIDSVLLEEINKHLQNVIRDPKLLTDYNFVHETSQIILDYLKDQQMFQNISERTGRPGEYLEAAVANWVLSIPVQGTNSVEAKQLEDAEREFAYRLKLARLQYHPNTLQHEKYIKVGVKRFLQSIIIDSCIRFDENFLNDRAEDLIRILKVVPIDQVNPNEEACPTKKDDTRTFKSPADILYDDVATWCQDLPINCGYSPDDMDKAQSIKQNLACKLINKIGTLNLNPEIFNDDYLYEQILLDELDIILTVVPKSSELVKYLPALKRHLVAKVKEARLKIRNELEAMNYKHQLREAIDTTIHFPGGLTSEEFASFEVFKDTISEAFINYLYTSDNDNTRCWFIKKVSDEVDKLCNDYIKRHEMVCCFNTDKIKTEVHKVLKSVHMPSDESMRSEVEQLKIKYLIYNWLTQIHFRDDTATGRLNRNKVTSILAKRIYEIEKEKVTNPYYDSYSNILDEIVKYMSKMPLTPGAEFAVQNLADNLMNTLQTSARARKLDSRKCLNSTQSESVSCKYSSSLSNADREHLQRIKERTGKISMCKDACLGPPPVDACSQTDVRPSITQTTNQNKSISIQCTSSFTPTAHSSWLPDSVSPEPCSALSPQGYINPPPSPNTTSYVSTASSPLTRSPPCASSTKYSCTAAGTSPSKHCSYQDSSMNQATADISPNVIVKEYVWEDSYPSQRVPTTSEPQQALSNRTNIMASGVPPTDSPSCVCRPDHRRTTLNRKPCMLSEPSSGGETCPSPSPMCRPRVINLGSTIEPPRSSYPYSRPKPKKAKSTRKPRSDDSLSTVEGPHEYYDICCKHRRDPWNSERREERSKCSCKERVLISCKGNPRLLREMCQRCGALCPHPTSLYFRD